MVDTELYSRYSSLFRFAIVWHSGFHRRANTLYVWDLFTGKDDFPTYLKYDVADIEKYSKFVYWASLNLNSNNEPRSVFFRIEDFSMVCNGKT